MKLATKITRLGIVLSFATHAQGQSGWTQDYLPSPGKISGTFAAKQDLNALQAFLSPGQTVSQLTAGKSDAGPALAPGMQRPACGTYRLDEPLLFTSTSRAYLDGGSSGCVVFNVNFPAGDIFLFNQTPRISFRDMRSMRSFNENRALCSTPFSDI